MKFWLSFTIQRKVETQKRKPAQVGSNLLEEQGTCKVIGLEFEF